MVFWLCWFDLACCLVMVAGGLHVWFRLQFGCVMCCLVLRSGLLVVLFGLVICALC